MKTLNNSTLRSAIWALVFASTAVLFAEDKAVEEIAAKRDTELTAEAKNPATVKAGKATYVSLCQSCHADAKATGDSPTNLFDAKWYHGGRPSQIEHTVLQGVIEKGMPGWGAVLPPEDTAAVTAFILSSQK
jgi:cytochrome c oxidase cbb3-type subunit 3